MASDVEISRLALSHIGDAARINSINPPDNSIQAQHCATFYPMARDELLEMHDWQFATKRWALELSMVDFPNGEWAYAYSLPSDYIRALKVCPQGAPLDYPGETFKIESDVTELDTLLLCNVPDATLHYIYREEETGRYSPTFVSAFSLLLGAYLAGPIIKGKIGIALADALRQRARQTFMTASAMDANASLDKNNYTSHVPLWISDR
jgi:hypothetical protein